QAPRRPSFQLAAGAANEERQVNHLPDRHPQPLISNLCKYLIFKFFQRFVAGSGAHYREFKLAVND
ncbi:hypothetical protein, partial [Pseudomonas nitroreducens]|uniref:hypothetical protein n=1 Tax=Pseudomonas nitroreducens TaxID=46680 RepID=UPI002FE15A42